MKDKKKITKIINCIVLILLIALIVMIKIDQKDKCKPTKVITEKVITKENNRKKIADIRKYENIVFLGDSITDFYPIDTIYMDLPIVKSGISGYTTEDILDRMDSMVYQYNPTSVFLLIGTNDIMYDGESTKEKTIENIEKILKNIKSNRKQTKIYLEAIYPVNKKLNSQMVRNRDNDIIREINDTLEKYCDENDITFIDMYEVLQDEEGNFSKDYTDDGLHPNDLGYAKISQVIAAYIYDIEL